MSSSINRIKKNIIEAMRKAKAELTDYLIER